VGGGRYLFDAGLEIGRELLVSATGVRCGMSVSALRDGLALTVWQGWI
jgi:hypothetical protein